MTTEHTLTDEQVQACINASTKENPAGCLAKVWEIILGKPLSEGDEPINVSDHNLPRSQVTKILDNAKQCVNREHAGLLMLTWLNSGPGNRPDE